MNEEMDARVSSNKNESKHPIHLQPGHNTQINR